MRACIAISVLALTMCGGADDEPSLADLLDRAGTYVQQFEREFALVLSDEEYRQAESFDSERKIEETNDIPRPYKIERQLDVHSEMLFMWVPQDRSWISVRSALKVGHQSIADSKDRLERVLKDEAPGRLTRLRQLAAESARFNLGFYHDQERDAAQPVMKGIDAASARPAEPRAAASAAPGPGQFGPEIQFDTKGVEFGRWIRPFIAQVKRNWPIPDAAMSMKGHVVITCNVHKDGAITDVEVRTPSAVGAFNNAARDAIIASNPVPPLPPEYPDEKAFFTVTFYYNELPPRADGSPELKARVPTK